MGISKWLFIRSGFRQSRGDGEQNGCVGIFKCLEAKYREVGRVELAAWNDDPEVCAEYVRSCSVEGELPEIGIIGYSWGCGYGAVQLARSLGHQGFRVDYMLLCDPVYHGLAVWRAMLPRTLFHNVSVEVPANVNSVWWLRQKVDKPAGHEVTAESPMTLIHEPTILDVGHCEMDNSPEFWTLSKRLAKFLFKEK